MNKELIVLLQPEGAYELDWQEIEEPIDKSQLLFQEELYKRFLEHTETALLFLGFSNQAVPLSESLTFLRVISASFVNALAKNPDIELLREKITVEIEPAEIVYLLRSVPYLNGAEYLNQDWILTVWEELNQAFAQEIRLYKGSVAEFIASYSPNVHLVGRVFFHLVESKNAAYPFAFLATYSAGLSKDG